MGLDTLLRSAIAVCLGRGLRAGAMTGSTILVGLGMNLAAPHLLAQVTTGTLCGTVTEESGVPIAGARVILESPALFQPRVYRTDAKGEYLALLLPVGNYTLKVSAAEHRSKTATDVRVGVGSNSNDSFRLKPTPTASNTVEVLANAAQTGCGGCGGCELGPGNRTTELDLLPLDASFHRALTLSAGVAGTGLGTSIRGSSAAVLNPVRYAIDGVDVTDVVGPALSRLGSQGFLAEPMPMAIEDEQVQLSPLNARYEGSGQVNLLMASGSNTFNGGLQLELSRPAWSTDRTRAASEDLAKGFQAFSSGPIVKDRLWFALGLQSQPATALPFLQQAPATMEALTQSRQRMDGKVTGMITDRHVISLSWHAEDGVLGTQNMDPGSVDRQPYQTRAWALTSNSTLSSNLTLEVQLATARRDHQRGQEGLNINLKTFLEGRGQHELDLGIDLHRSSFHPGTATETLTQARNESRSLWINDSWTLNSNWCVLLGLRAASSELQVGDRQTQDQTLQPRLQAKWNPDGRNQNLLQASFATYASGFPGDPAPGLAPASLRVPTVTESLLGYTHSSDQGSVSLNLVQRVVHHEFAMTENPQASEAPGVLANAPGAQRYRGFEASWQKNFSDRISFGGAYTLGRSAEARGPQNQAWDQLIVTTLTRKWRVDRSFIVLGLLARYADSERGPRKRGQDPWSADLRATAELALKNRVALSVVVQIENVFNHAPAMAAQAQDAVARSTAGTGARDSLASETWSQPSMRGRSVARFSVGIHF